MNPVKVLGQCCSLVTLAGTDEVPFASLGADGLNPGYFIESFLEIVLSKASLTSFDSIEQIFSRAGFADGKQLNITRLAARICCSICNSLQDCAELLSNLGHRMCAGHEFALK